MGDPKDLYLKKTSAILKMYNGTTMTHLGKCTLKCAKSEMSRDADFFYNWWGCQASIGCWDISGTQLNQGYGKWHIRFRTVNAVNDKALTAHIVLARDQILKEYSDGFEGLGYNTIQYNTIQYNTMQILLSTPREGFSETSINRTSNQKKKRKKKYHKLIINKLLRNCLHINFWH